jgi:hypothetical protein
VKQREDVVEGSGRRGGPLLGDIGDDNPTYCSARVTWVTRRDVSQLVFRSVALVGCFVGPASFFSLPDGLLDFIVLLLCLGPMLCRALL